MPQDERVDRGGEPSRIDDPLEGRAPAEGVHLVLAAGGLEVEDRGFVFGGPNARVHRRSAGRRPSLRFWSSMELLRSTSVAASASSAPKASQR